MSNLCLSYVKAVTIVGAILRMAVRKQVSDRYPSAERQQNY